MANCGIYCQPCFAGRAIKPPYSPYSFPPPSTSSIASPKKFTVEATAWSNLARHPPLIFLGILSLYFSSSDWPVYMFLHLHPRTLRISTPSCLSMLINMLINLVTHLPTSNTVIKHKQSQTEALNTTTKQIHKTQSPNK